MANDSLQPRVVRGVERRGVSQCQSAYRAQTHTGPDCTWNDRSSLTRKGLGNLC